MFKGDYFLLGNKNENIHFNVLLRFYDKEKITAAEKEEKKTRSGLPQRIGVEKFPHSTFFFEPFKNCIDISYTMAGKLAGGFFFLLLLTLTY